MVAIFAPAKAFDTGANDHLAIWVVKNYLEAGYSVHLLICKDVILSTIPVRDNVEARTSQANSVFPGAVKYMLDIIILSAGSTKVGEDPKQRDLPELIGAVSDGIMALLPFLGTHLHLFLRAAPLTNSHHYVNKNSYCQDYGNDLTKAPVVFARLGDGAIVMDLESS